jgi:selenophosphate synthase
VEIVIALKVGIQAYPDIIGLGLVRHLAEMIWEGNLDIENSYVSVLLFSRTEEFATIVIFAPEYERNGKYRDVMLEAISDLVDWERQIVFDPKTSGDPVFPMSLQKAERLLKKIHKTE